MADLSTVDLASVIERLTGAIRFGKEQSRGDKRTRKGGPCPFCGLGKDRFAVFVNDTPQHYYCGIHGTGCGAWGDAITFVRHYLDKDYWEACEILDVGPDSTYTGPRRKKGVDEDIPPSEQWQEKAVAFCQEAKEMLHSSQWQDAMKWLTNERG